MTQLVLSLFPGIGLLDMAFEEEGFCVVRGPDLLWGGDIRRFHPPAGKFDGVIGGPPCQAFSQLRFIVKHNGYAVAPNLIPEFERVVRECWPTWFLMENVPAAPLPHITGVDVTARLVRDVAVGGRTSRLRRFTYGGPGQFDVEELALHDCEPEKAVLATGGRREVPVAVGGNGKRKRSAKSALVNYGYNSRDGFRRMCDFQGLPAGYLDAAPLTLEGKSRAIGNGVPLPMGRAVARAVKRALGIENAT